MFAVFTSNAYSPTTVEPHIINTALLFPSAMRPICLIGLIYFGKIHLNSPFDLNENLFMGDFVLTYIKILLFSHLISTFLLHQ